MNRPYKRVKFMYKYNKTKYRFHYATRLTALVTVCAFLFNTVFQDMALGAVKTNFSPKHAEIPFAITSSVETVKGTNNKTVYFIQDAHCNYSCQKSIRSIFEHLTNNEHIKTALLEGGSGGYDLSLFTDIRDKDKRERISDFFVKEGRVSGAEYFAVNSPSAISLTGLEDEGLYLENLKTYRDSLSNKDAAIKVISELENNLNALKPHVFSETLAAFESKRSDYANEKLELKDYILVLSESADSQKIDTGAYPNIAALKQLIDKEKGIDFKQANAERDMFVDELSKRLSDEDLRELTERTVQFRDGTIKEDAFYAYIFRKAFIIGMDVDRFPSLNAYREYAGYYEKLDKAQLFTELDRMEEAIADRLCVTKDERELYTLITGLRLMRALSDIKMTREMLGKYLSAKEKLGIDSYTDFISEKSAQYGMNSLAMNVDLGFAGYIRSMEKFYELAESRETAFIKNIDETLRKEDKIIIVTGGFHTESLKKEITERGATYVQIMPKLECQAECPYYRILAGGLTPFEKSMSAGVSLIQVPSLLNITGTKADPGVYQAVSEIVRKAENEPGILEDARDAKTEKGLTDVKPKNGRSGKMSGGEMFAALASLGIFAVVAMEYVKNNKVELLSRISNWNFVSFDVAACVSLTVLMVYMSFLPGKKPSANKLTVAKAVDDFTAHSMLLGFTAGLSYFLMQGIRKDISIGEANIFSQASLYIAALGILMPALDFGARLIMLSYGIMKKMFLSTSRIKGPSDMEGRRAIFAAAGTVLLGYATRVLALAENYIDTIPMRGRQARVIMELYSKLGAKKVIFAEKKHFNDICLAYKIEYREYVGGFATPDGSEIYIAVPGLTALEMNVNEFVKDVIENPSLNKSTRTIALNTAFHEAFHLVSARDKRKRTRVPYIHAGDYAATGREFYRTVFGEENAKMMETNGTVTMNSKPLVKMSSFLTTLRGSLSYSKSSILYEELCAFLLGALTSTESIPEKDERSNHWRAFDILDSFQDTPSDRERFNNLIGYYETFFNMYIPVSRYWENKFTGGVRHIYNENTSVVPENNNTLLQTAGIGVLGAAGMSGPGETPGTRWYKIGGSKVFDDLAEARDAILDAKERYCFAVIKEPKVPDLEALVKDDRGLETGIIRMDLGNETKHDFVWLIVKADPKEFKHPIGGAIDFRAHTHSRLAAYSDSDTSLRMQYLTPGPTDIRLAAPDPQNDKKGMIEYLVTENGLWGYGGQLKEPIFATWEELAVENDRALYRLRQFFVEKQNELGNMEQIEKKNALDGKTKEILMSVQPEQGMLVSIYDPLKHSEVKKVLKKKDLLQMLLSNDEVQLRIEEIYPLGEYVEPGASELSKFDDEKMVAELKLYPNHIWSVVVLFASGEAANFYGNGEMLFDLARGRDIVKISFGEGPGWFKNYHGVSPIYRVKGQHAALKLVKEIGPGIRSETNDGTSDLGGMEVYHGTIKGFSKNIFMGPKNVGSGFGGRGLYLAVKGEKRIADLFAEIAKDEAAARNVFEAEGFDNSMEPGTAIQKEVVTGNINPRRSLKVGTFTIIRDGRPDLANGILPADWDRDPLLRNVLENEFDILDIRNMNRNGLAIETDRVLVVHERAGKDAIIWQTPGPDLTSSNPPAHDSTDTGFALVERAAGEGSGIFFSEQYLGEVKDALSKLDNITEDDILAVIKVLRSGLHDDEDHWFYSRLIRLLGIHDIRQPESGVRVYHKRVELKKNDGLLQRLINAVTPYYGFDINGTLIKPDTALKPHSAERLVYLILHGRKVGIVTGRGLEDLAKIKDKDDGGKVEFYAPLRNALIDKMKQEGWGDHSETVAEDILCDQFELFFDSGATRLLPIKGAKTQDELAVDVEFQRGLPDEVINNITEQLTYHGAYVPYMPLYHALNRERETLFAKGYRKEYAGGSPRLEVSYMKMPDGRKIATRLVYRPFVIDQRSENLLERDPLEYKAVLRSRLRIEKVLREQVIPMLRASQSLGSYSLEPVTAGRSAIDLNILITNEHDRTEYDVSTIKYERVQKDRAIELQRDLGHRTIYYFDNEALTGNGLAVTRRLFAERMEGIALTVIAADTELPEILKRTMHSSIRYIGRKEDGIEEYLDKEIESIGSSNKAQIFMPGNKTVSTTPEPDMSLILRPTVNEIKYKEGDILLDKEGNVRVVIHVDRMREVVFCAKTGHDGVVTHGYHLYDSEKFSLEVLDVLVEDKEIEVRKEAGVIDNIPENAREMIDECNKYLKWLEECRQRDLVLERLVPGGNLTNTARTVYMDGHELMERAANFVTSFGSVTITRATKQYVEQHEKEIRDMLWRTLAFEKPWLDRTINTLKSPDSISFLACEGDRVVGCVTGAVPGKADSKKYLNQIMNSHYLITIATDKTRKIRGIGRKLLSIYIDAVAATGQYRYITTHIGKKSKKLADILYADHADIIAESLMDDTKRRRLFVLDLSLRYAALQRAPPVASREEISEQLNMLSPSIKFFMDLEHPTGYEEFLPGEHWVIRQIEQEEGLSWRCVVTRVETGEEFVLVLDKADEEKPNRVHFSILSDNSVVAADGGITLHNNESTASGAALLESGAQVNVLDILSDEKNSFMLPFEEIRSFKMNVSANTSAVSINEHLVDMETAGVNEGENGFLDENKTRNGALPLEFACGPCTVMIVYDTKTHETFYAHSNYGDMSILADIWKQAEEYFNGRGTNVSVFFGGGSTVTEELDLKYLSAPETAEMPFDIEKNRCVLINEIAGAGFNVVTVFPDFTEVGLRIKFYPDRGELIVTENAMPELGPVEKISAYQERLKASAQKKQSQPGSVSSADIGDVSTELLNTIPRMSQPCTIGVVVKTKELGKINDVVDEQTLRIWKQFADKVDDKIGIKAGVSMGQISYVFCLDDGTQSEDNMKRLNDFAEQLKVKGNPKTRTVAWVISDDQRKNDKVFEMVKTADGAKLNDIAHLVGVNGEVIPVSWQMLAGPEFVNLVSTVDRLKGSNTGDSADAVSRIIEKLKNNISSMMKGDISSIEGQLESLKIAALAALKTGDMTELGNKFNGLAFVLDLPRIAPDTSIEKLEAADRAVRTSL